MKNNDEVLGFIYIVAALLAAFYFATHVGQIDPTLSEQEYKEQVRLLTLSPIAFAAFSIIGVCNIKFRKTK
jgi:hypothetical protein